MSLKFEKHRPKTEWLDVVDPCSCSYCVGENKLHYGLNIPKDWTYWNSWWIIKYGNGKYIRWTHPFLKNIKNKKQ
jgi:hypothetical protein